MSHGFAMHGTPKYPADAGVRWVSDGQGEFTIEAIDRPARGTEVVLHLKEEDSCFTENRLCR